MSKLRLNGSTSGYSELSAPAVAGSNTLTLPTGAGSANQFLKNGATAGSLGWSSLVEDSSSRLLVGTSTARGVGSSYSFPIQNENTSVAGITFVTNTNDAESSYLVLGKSRGTSTGSNTIVQVNDVIGRITFAGADGTDLETRAATIEAQVDGTPGANDMPGRLVFSTTADGAASPTERLRIDSLGNLLLGTTTTSVSGGSGGTYLRSKASGGSSSILLGHENGTATGNSFAEFFYNTSMIGSIVQNGTTAVSYNTSSDYRLKENVVAVTDGITRLLQLKPSRFNFIADPDRTVDGFIAHEVQTVIPEAIHGTKDEVDADGNPVYQGIDQSKLVPLLTAALQEAIAKIESLEARLTALEVTP